MISDIYIYKGIRKPTLCFPRSPLLFVALMLHKTLSVSASSLKFNEREDCYIRYILQKSWPIEGQ